RDDSAVGHRVLLAGCDLLLSGLLGGRLLGGGLLLGGIVGAGGVLRRRIPRGGLVGGALLLRRRAQLSTLVLTRQRTDPEEAHDRKHEEHDQQAAADGRDDRALRACGRSALRGLVGVLGPGGTGVVRPVRAGVLGPGGAGVLGPVRAGSVGWLAHRGAGAVLSLGDPAWCVRAFGSTLPKFQELFRHCSIGRRAAAPARR